MKITKATAVQYILETLLRANLTANELKVASAWICDKFGFNPTAGQLAKRCNISEPAALVAIKGLKRKSILTFVRKEKTYSGKYKNIFNFGPAFDPAKVFSTKIDLADKERSKSEGKSSKVSLWYVDKWPHISAETDRLLPIAQKYLKRSSPRKKIAKLEGFKNAISTQIQNQDYKYIDYKIPSFNELANAIVYELNEYIREYDDIQIPLFPMFERLQNPTEKKNQKK